MSDSKAKRPALVIIDWVDSGTNKRYWANRDDVAAHSPLECRTVGYLIKDCPTHKTVASSLIEATDEVGGCVTIPKVAIVRTRKLKEPPHD